MKKILLAVFGLITCTHSYSQSNEWTIQAGEDMKDALGDSVIFRYPQFTLGSVYFRDGSVSNAPLNLNLINGEMQFIAPSEDTMTINNEVTIKYITIHTDTFYFDKVYVELVYGNTIAELAKLEIIKPMDVKKGSGYDQSSSVFAITSASSFYTNNTSRVYKLTENKSIILHKETIYFIGDRYSHFLPAYKKNIYEMFNKKERAIETFIKENKIVLSKEDDLIKLVDFLEKM